jgi:hypothetical protein
VYTYKLLKRYNVFGYNDAVTLVVDRNDFPVPHPAPMPLLTRSRSGSGGHESLSPGIGSPSGHRAPHHNTFMENMIGTAESLAEATGHGLLGGKVRKTQLYPSMSAPDADPRNKKGI